MRAQRNSVETNSPIDPTVCMDQRLKMEEVVPKITRRRGSDAGQSKRS